MENELPASKRALQAALAEALDIDSIPGEIWDGLDADGYLRDYFLRREQPQFEELVKQIRRRMRREPGRRPGQKTARVLESVLDPRELKRAAVRSRHLARLASRRDTVRNLRDRLFGGRILTVEEAQALLQQVGPRYFHAEWFSHQGIPLVGHRSYFFDPKLGPDFPDWTTDTMIRFEWDAASMDVTNALQLDIDADRLGVRLQLPHGELVVRSSSVLGDIQQVAADLAEHYDWDEASATVFLLVGKLPFVPPIGVKSRGGWRDDHRDCASVGTAHPETSHEAIWQRDLVRRIPLDLVASER